MSMIRTFSVDLKKKQCQLLDSFPVLVQIVVSYSQKGCMLLTAMQGQARDLLRRIVATTSKFRTKENQKPHCTRPPPKSVSRET